MGYSFPSSGSNSGSITSSLLGTPVAVGTPTVWGTQFTDGCEELHFTAGGTSANVRVPLVGVTSSVTFRLRDYFKTAGTPVGGGYLQDAAGKYIHFARYNSSTIWCNNFTAAHADAGNVFSFGDVGFGSVYMRLRFSAGTTFAEVSSDNVYWRSIGSTAYLADIASGGLQLGGVAGVSATALYDYATPS